MTTRAQIIVRGMVQGVGFRPFVYSNASRRALHGRVLNNAAGVLIDLEGDASEIDRFVCELQSNPPPLASIESIERLENLVPLDYEDFQILESDSAGRKFVPVPADVATCDDCLRELFDKSNRRYRYPFINCTNCGPRFTIVKRVPYDRENTTMQSFEMCDACRAEYENPLDRRFHAEPIACEVCGPCLHLLDREGRYFSGNAVATANMLLVAGKILAIKGIGGFHLACDALSKDAVNQLRGRKFREDKPFAVMARSVEMIRSFCRISSNESALLESPARPIVLLERKRGNAIPRAVAPGVNTLGFMLPYTPLHYLLLESLDRPIVMTSGNISDEPICFRDNDASERLHGIADYFLVHDRPIHTRTDDSVVRSFNEREMVLRRSRGFAPAAVRTSFKFERSILACGAELKNTFCLARGHSAFVSHHIGDLENLETLRSFTEGIEHYKHLFDVEPEVVAYDLHPEYLSTKYALSLDCVSDKLAVQHHHAHIASCMADNEIDGEVIGVAFDGLGFGLDGKLWGGEFFVADFCDAERVAHLANVPLPGGTKAIREPWRLAAVYLQRAFGNNFTALDLPFTRELDPARWTTLDSMIAARVNCPETSSMGRLFDAVSGLLTLRSSVNYEGQAAIELEGIADKVATGFYEFQIVGDEIAAEPVVRRMVEDLLDEVPLGQISARFHLSVAHLIVNVAQAIRDERHLNRVALSGGVFQNIWLLEQVTGLLREHDFEVFTHRRVPANDGGISLGQAAVANARIMCRRSN
ncbi:MAG TPA: carbamoyltransferase HypF [Pyrinomonadaceae bacterium]|nr:carbamoyltransferase HypF [Pyrinomonadaceae bacterium]